MPHNFARDRYAPCRTGSGSLNRAPPGIRSIARLARSVPVPRHTWPGRRSQTFSSGHQLPFTENRWFTPVARSSYVWQDYYDQRSAVERVNSRLAGGFGFERPGIRGLAKMRLRVTMALTIMLAMALGRIRAGQPEHLRSLIKPA